MSRYSKERLKKYTYKKGKWYLPFILIFFTWIYIRRSVGEINVMALNAMVGEQVKKLAHDIPSPIQRMKSLFQHSPGENLNHVLLGKNLSELELISNSILKDENDSSPSDLRNSFLISVILEELKAKYISKIKMAFELSSFFDWYQVDNEVFTRIFINMINNLIKAGATEIHFSGSYRNRKVVLKISDDGQGIPPSLQPYIFERGITSDKSLGSGLGLNFTQAKLKDYGGDIKLSRSSNRGAEFMISIPLEEIVLIDNNQLVIDAWIEIGKVQKIQVIPYTSSLEFISNNKITKLTPIFIDYELGKEKGQDVAFTVRSMGFQCITIATGVRRKVGQNFQQISKEFPISNSEHMV